MEASPLNQLVLRGLADKFYEKRKQAALEVEKVVREHLSANERQRIQKVIDCLIQDFAYSVSANSRNGGLIGLAATAIALGQAEISLHLNELMPPVLACLVDQDARVRYYACEAMYNICKVARGESLAFFNEIFDALSKLAADLEISVKNGADLLDRLMKDIVSEQSLKRNPGDSADPLQKTADSSTFSLPRFIPLLSERIYAVNQFTRSFLISWITVLDSVPELELVSFLPEFLDGLLGFVSDPNEDVRIAATNILSEFLREIRDIAEAQNENPVMDLAFSSLTNLSINSDDDEASMSPIIPPASIGMSIQNPEEGKAWEGDDSTKLEVTNVESGKKSTRRIHIAYEKIISILLPHTRSFSDEQTKMISLTWLTHFVILAGNLILRMIPDIVACVLPCLSHASLAIRRGAEVCDKFLRKLILNSLQDESGGNSAAATASNKNLLDYDSTVHALTLLFLNDHEKTRIASFDWLIMLHKKAQNRVISPDSTAFPSLLKTLSDESEKVVRKNLQLLAQISSVSSDAYFTKIISSLLGMFAADRHLLEARGNLIIRQLCIHLNTERIYQTLAEILEKEVDLEFASLMVQNLNLILMTAAELVDLRRKLKSLDTKEGQALFVKLYRSWCHNAVATFSLCLLAQAYEHAALLIHAFTDLEMTVNLLVQVDKLVQLLESPVFTYLRLQLLEPEKYPHLYKSLYGILMLLPQSSAFATLRNRLNSVGSLGMLQLLHKPGTPAAVKKIADSNAELDFSELSAHFCQFQNFHEKVRRQGALAIDIEFPKKEPASTQPEDSAEDFKASSVSPAHQKKSKLGFKVQRGSTKTSASSATTTPSAKSKAIVSKQQLPKKATSSDSISSFPSVPDSSASPSLPKKE